MYRKILLTLILGAIAFMARAQGVLEVEDLSQANAVYSSSGDQAAVEIRCNHTIPLSFSSTMDKSVDLFSTEIQGTDSIYFIEFPAGPRYRGRVITISAPGYNPVELPLDLEPKQLRTFKISDPNSLVDQGCYRTHRNMGVREIQNANYEEALNQFNVAKQCSDCDTLENNMNIIRVDSLIKLREDADILYRMLDYSAAAEIFSNIVRINSYDSYALSKLRECEEQFASECAVAFKQAEAYFDNKLYEKARTLYQRVVDNGCEQAKTATERLNSISNYLTAKEEHASVIMYEWMDDAPIGIHYGRYNNTKGGIFIHLNINSKLLSAMQSNNSNAIPDHPEANFGIGWTKRIGKLPVWATFGPGVTVKGYYGDYAKIDKNSHPDKHGYPTPEADILDIQKDDGQKLNAAIAITPEVGLAFKYSYFAVRASYHYRFALNNALQDFMGKSVVSFGIGFAF